MIGKAFFQNLAESANPVFIKEMRQYFQNRRMILFMGILLLAEFILALVFSVPANNGEGENSEAVLFFVLIFLGGALLSVLICAVGSALRFTDERCDRELNYSMLTTLKPSSIIMGKVEGALVMLLFIFSMLVPFLTAAYFMRGLSAASLLIVLYMIPILLLFTLSGILAGSFGMRWITVLFLVALAAAAVIFLIWAVIFVSELMDTAALEEFWIALGVEWVVSFLAAVLLFLLSVAVVAPPKSNRLLPVKIYLFAMPFITFAIMTPFLIIYRRTAFSKETFYVFEYLFSSCSFFVLLLISLFEQPEAGIRVYMKCPRNFPGRAIHFLFSSGFSGSIVLAILIMAIPAVLLAPLRFSTSWVIGSCGFLCIQASILGSVILSLVLAWRTKLPLAPWLWEIIFLLGGNMTVGILTAINAGFELDLISRPMRAVLMPFSPIYTFFGEIIDGTTKHSPIPAGLALTLILSSIFFLFLIPIMVRAFRRHHYPDESAAIKTPTPEMLKK